MKRLLASVAALALLSSPAQANFTFPNASSASVTAFAFDTATGGTGNCGTTYGAECGGSVPMTTAGLPLFVTGNAGLVTGTGGTFPATESGTWNVGLSAGSAIAGKFGIDQTTVGTTNGVSLAQIGTATILAGTGAVGTGAQRVAVGTDTATIAGSAPSTILQTNNAQWGGTAITNVPTAVGTAGTGNTPTINAYIVGGGGSGGTSSNFAATFPTAGTAAGAEYLSSAPTLTSGQMVALQTTSAGSLHTTVDNSNANGSAISASSSPVVIASDQAAVAIKAASAAIASGAVASGAFASGSVASGAFASGSLASGAGVDGWNLTEGTKADSAYTGSGSASVVAALKGLYNIVNTPPPLGTTGGWTPTGSAAAALSNTVVSVKASAGWLAKAECYNPNATVEYVEFFNVASGSVTLGTTAYLDFVPVPGTATVGFIMPVQGEQFGTAISVAAVTALNGSSAPATALNCAIAYN